VTKTKNGKKTTKEYFAEEVRNNENFTQKYTFTFDNKWTVKTPEATNGKFSFTLSPQATVLNVAKYDKNTDFSWDLYSVQIEKV